MRNFTLMTLLVTLLSVGVATAQKRAVMSKVTATWCPRCGGYGWDIMETLKADYNQNGDDALVLGVHYSGNLQTPVSQWMASNLKVSGQPQFFVSNENYFVTSSNWQAKVDEIKSGVSDYLNNQSSFADATIQTYDVVADNGDLNINVQVTSQDSPDDLYLGVYIYENNVMDVQAGRSGMVAHPNVLREALTSENFGVQIRTAGTQGADNQTYTYAWTPNAEYDIDNIGVLAIVWRKQGDDYVLDYSTAISTFASVTSDVEELDASIFTISNDDSYINILANNSNLYIVDLYNSAGQSIKQTSFSNRTSIASNDLTSGIYILTLTDGNKRLTKKIHIK